MTSLLPLHAGHGPHGWDGGPFFLLPLLFFLMLLPLLALTGWYLWRQGKLALPQAGPRGHLEDDARRILAERFARGDISPDEFLERASMLNWSPGSDAFPPRRGGASR